LKIENSKTLTFVVLTFLVWPFFFCSCNTTSEKNKTVEGKGEITNNLFAKGFEIEDFGSYKKITVRNPWQKSKEIEFRYYLVKRGNKVPEELKNEMVIFTPVQRIVCLSTTHIGFIDALGEISSLKGLSGTDFVSNIEVLQLIADKKIVDVGYDQNINHELVLSLQPDVVMAYGVGGEVSSYINKLRDLGITVILNGEYLEENPLAKAEWVKYVGALYEKDSIASNYFNNISERYLQIKSDADSVKNRPKVLTGLPWKEAWWMAGGNSNLAALIKDAGGEFLWSENSSREAFVVSIEDVFVRSEKADLWINCGVANSVSDLLSIDSRFSNLLPLKNRRIYNNNKRMSAGGGNDYWESGVVRPDLILADLVKIFHPDKIKEKDFYYYKKIE
jgi:iron complex transport system substrate-binding protein